MISCVLGLFSALKYRNVLFSLALLAVILLAAWTTLSYHSHHTQSSTTALLPDAYMEVVTAVILDKQGKPSMKIETPKMVHYIENDTSHLTNPQLTMYRKSPQPWFVTSNFAKAVGGIEHLDFWDDVTIHHAADLASPATVIKTLKLTVYPNAQTAETNEQITMTQPNITVKATGMFADLNTGDIKLLSEARGEYAPN